jgi:hypothetical protein
VRLPRYRTLDGDEVSLPLAMDRWVLVPRTLARFDPELAWTLDCEDAPEPEDADPRLDFSAGGLLVPVERWNEHAALEPNLAPCVIPAPVGRVAGSAPRVRDSAPVSIPDGPDDRRSFAAGPARLFARAVSAGLAVLAIAYVAAVTAWLWSLRHHISGPDVSTGVLLLGAAMLLAWFAGVAGAVPGVRSLLVGGHRHALREPLAAELALGRLQARVAVDLVQHQRGVLEAEVAERHLHLRVRDPLGRGDDDDLVGVVDGEGRDRRGHAGASRRAPASSGPSRPGRGAPPAGEDRSAGATRTDAARRARRSGPCRAAGRRAIVGRGPDPARSASVPKSGFRSTASTRSRRCPARTFPARNVLVVLPQPPFGDRVTTMLVRDTPGSRRRLLSSWASSRSSAVVRSARSGSRRRVSSVLGIGLPSMIGTS